MIDLSKSRVLVTGASSGIGREVAIQASRAGASVVLVGRDAGRLEETRNACGGSRHAIEEFNLSDYATIPAWLGEVVERHGPLNGLVHSAGIHELKPIQFVKPKNVEDVFAVNVQAAIQLTKGFRKQTVFTPPASIVLLSSVMALVGQPATVSYSASKGAISAMTRTLALELAPQQIRVNSISPGTVRTAMTQELLENLPEEQVQRIEQMHPLGLGEPKDVANAAIFLLADSSKWMTGSTMVVDGGYTAH